MHSHNITDEEIIQSASLQPVLNRLPSHQTPLKTTQNVLNPRTILIQKGLVQDPIERFQVSIG